MFQNSNGGASNGGDSNGGDSNGGDVVSLTGLQAYAGDVVSPILMRGLWTTRGHLLQSEPPGGWSGSLAPRPPAPGAADPQTRWYACVSEFMGGLTWTIENPDTALVQVGLKANQPAASEKQPNAPEKQLHPCEKVHLVLAPEAFRKWQGQTLDLTEEVRKIHSLANYREERLSEINSQIVIPWSYFAMILGLQSGRHRHTLELMQVLFSCGKSVVLRVKNHFNCIRPADLDPSIMPIIATPAHSSYPAGHATEGTLVATVLKKVAGAKGHTASGKLDLLAKRIAENRIVAGLHYPVDNDAGAALGEWLADYALNCLTKEKSYVWSWLVTEAKKEWLSP